MPGSGWRYDAERYERITALRRHEQAAMAAFGEDELGAILAYDSTHDSSLFPTLVAFLDCDGNKTTAANDLYIQRRTLYYRLEKIAHILGLSLEDSEVRLRLKVAIRARELLANARSVRGFQP